MKYAVIDIGSNSVRLMLWADGKTLYKKVETTRLGKNLSAGNLTEDAMSATVAAVERFADEGRRAGAEVFAFATAAVRTAKNGGKIVARLLSRGIAVDVVPGEVEAEIGMSGALGESDGGIIDVGGASTEVRIRENGEIKFSVSIPIGAVRLKDECKDNAQKITERLKNELKSLKPIKKPVKMCAIGGTAATLACLNLGIDYDAERLNGLKMSAEYLQNSADRLLNMSVSERKALAGMEEKRADIIAGGAAILSAVVEKLGVPYVEFSDADNLEGYLNHLFSHNFHRKKG